MNWECTKVDGIPIYRASNDYWKFEIRTWPYDESGEGRFQLCKDDYHVANFKTLNEAKDMADVL